MKITKEEFEKLYSDTITVKEFDSIIERIDIRVEEIIRYISTDFKWWDYNNYSEKNNGVFDKDDYKEFIGISGIFKLSPPFSYCPEIPSSWLWKDFEEAYHKEVLEERLKQQNRPKTENY